MNKYFDNIKIIEKKGKQYYRWEMVICTLQNGIGKTAKTFNATRKTVRNRETGFKEGGYDNLINESRKEHSSFIEFSVIQKVTCLYYIDDKITRDILLPKVNKID